MKTWGKSTGVEEEPGDSLRGSTVSLESSEETSVLRAQLRGKGREIQSTLWAAPQWLWHRGEGEGDLGSAHWFASEINKCFNKLCSMAHWYLGNRVACFWWKVRCKYLGEREEIDGARERRESLSEKKPFERIKDETPNRVHGAGLERDSRINLKPTTAAFSSAAVQHEVRQHKLNSNRRQMVLEVCRHREKLDVIHYSQVQQAFSYRLNKLLQHLHRIRGLAR